MLLGFVLFYLFSLGMGILFIFFGIIGGKLLLKVGNWMNVVKVIFGFMMLVVVIVFIEWLWISLLLDFIWVVWGFGLFGYYWYINCYMFVIKVKLICVIIVVMGIMGSVLVVFYVGINVGLWGE